MKGKTIGWAVTVALTTAILTFWHLAQENTAEVELSPVVVTQEPIEIILTPVVMTAEPTPETLPSVVMTIALTEEVIDIYIKPQGACVDILEASTCLDYWGDYWTPQTMALQCSAPGATYITNPCPTEDRMGGCRFNKGQPTEFIMWIYRIGGEAFTEATAGAFLNDCATLGAEPLP
ncbi:MAG TPA: hypothetical protein G4O04_00290 [Anaerolineae bacterium]|nr:hypothetical protein [Anaerolineae bacterium]HID84903.1 hypothetical protein [Anaerolineales bacterium]HIQ07925.1 hypothetical protein [Anaerolineaceae bacterium]